MNAQDVPDGWHDLVFVFMLGAREGELDRIKTLQGGGGSGGASKPPGKGGARGATDAEMMEMLETVRREREKKGG